MDVTFASQSQGFLYSCIVGFALGAFYDIFRMIRIMCRTERRHVFFQDLFFMVCAAFVTFLLALAVNWGELRFYIVAGEIIGICVYDLTVGEVTVRIARFVYKILRIILRFLNWLIIRPLKSLFIWIFGLVKNFFKKLTNFFIKYIKKRNK